MQIWKVCIFKHKKFCWSSKYCTSFTCSEFWIGYLLNTCIWFPGAGRSTPPCHHVLAWTYLQRQFAVWTILHEALIPEKKTRIKSCIFWHYNKLIPRTSTDRVRWTGDLNWFSQITVWLESLILPENPVDKCFDIHCFLSKNNFYVGRFQIGRFLQWNVNMS